MDAISGIVSRARVRSVAAYSMGTGRANNRIARDRVVANQIIDRTARARGYMYFFFKLFLWPNILYSVLPMKYLAFYCMAPR